MAAHQWGFAPRFRRNAFGWKSDLPIKRIKEAVTEIKAVARKDTVLAAEGGSAVFDQGFCGDRERRRIIGFDGHCRQSCH